MAVQTNIELFVIASSIFMVAAFRRIDSLRTRPHFAVPNTTTLGELLQNPKTQPVITKLLAPVAGAAEAGAASEADKALMQKVLEEMPLKSLVSVMPGEQVEMLVAQMNECLRK